VLARFWRLLAGRLPLRLRLRTLALSASRGSECARLYEYEYDPPPDRQEIDERWFKEYAEWGVQQLVQQLKNHAAFLDWLAKKEQEDV